MNGFINVAEFAALAGVSKQAIYKQVHNKNSQLAPYVIRIGRGHKIDVRALKELYQAEIPKLGELIETRAGSSLTDEENRNFLASFSSQTVSMLKSYGFTEKDWGEFESMQDPALVSISSPNLGISA